MPKKVLITGGTGFIGLHLGRELLKRDKDVFVIAFDNFSNSCVDSSVKELEEKYGERFLVVEGDVCSGKFPLVEVSEVYHLAAIRGTKFSNFSFDTLEKNIKGTIEVVNTFANKDVKIVFASTGEVFGGIHDLFPARSIDEDTPVGIPGMFDARWTYALSKIVGEMAFTTKSGKWKWSIVRMQNPYGPRMGWDNVVPKFIKRILDGENPLIVETPDDTRPFTYIDDVVDGLIVVMKSSFVNSQVVNVANPEEIKVGKLARELARLGDVEIKNLKQEKIERRWLDINKLITLGWSPKVSLDDGLGRTLRWYEKNYGD